MYLALLLLCQLPPALPALPEPVSFETLRVADEAATLAPAVELSQDAPVASATPSPLATAGVLQPSAFVSLPRPLARSQSCAGGSCQSTAVVKQSLTTEPRRFALPSQPVRRLFGRFRR